MVFICRLCGNDDYQSSGVEIFSKQGINKALAYKIKLSLDITVYEYDPLPKYVCKICIDKLFMTFTFQESCRRTQIELRERALATENWSLNGTAVNLDLEKQLNNVSNACHSQQGEMLSRLVNAGTLQSPMSANPEAPLTLHGHPFEFNAFMRNGILDDLAKVVKGGNSQQKKSRIPKKPRQTGNTRRRKQNANNNSEEPSSIIAPENNPVPVSSQPSVMQAVQLPQNEASVLQLSNDIVSCSSGAPTHEARNALPFFVPNQQDTKCESIKIVDVYSVQDPNNTAVTDPTTNSTKANNSSPCISVISGTSTIAIPVVDSPLTPSSYVTPASTSVPISFLVAQNPPNVGSWHSPTITNAAAPDNFQTSSDLTSTPTTRNWHTPSQTMPESSIETPISTGKCDANLTPPREKNARPESATSTTPNSESITNITSKTPESRTSNASELPANIASAQNNEEEDDEEEEEDIFIVEVVKANKSSIAQHWEKCDEGYRCKDCKKTYKKLVKCENHVRTHLGIRPFECKSCRRRFLKRRLLNEHIIIHTGRKLYQCKECPKAFRYRKNFKLHLEVHTEIVSRSYLCEICRKTFKSQYDYWNHKTSKHILDIAGAVAVD